MTSVVSMSSGISLILQFKSKVCYLDRLLTETGELESSSSAIWKAELKVVLNTELSKMQNFTWIYEL